MERIVIGGQSAQHVQAYIEYERIVGGADGGNPMSELQFEEYKQNVKEARRNRLYVHWRSDEGQDCKTIGPSSQCFCGHRYKGHHHDNVGTREIYCRENKDGKKCPCKMFEYIPVFGSQDLKCMCKHSCHEHNPNGARKCGRGAACKGGCQGFTSSFSCTCGLTFNEHQTTFESREERQAQGRPVDANQDTNMVAGMGGLGSDHMALADGQDLMDMKNPAAIVGNMNRGNMLMAPGMQRAIQQHGIDPNEGLHGGPPKKMIGGPKRGGAQGSGQMMLQGNSQQQQMAETGNNGVNALALFSTPHSLGGSGAFGGGLPNSKQKRLGYK